ncbi:class I SAM-dependent methyltransferase [Allosphingosinicella sp.]|uniref:class I SAM-dependent methyltransferase n=1 Tax=Allosphingosinicella sp. TaxID=2823234 RepID=UPI00378374B9
MSGSLEEARANRRFARKSSGGPLWHFVLGFIKHPMMVGSVIPSSKAMVDKMLAPVDWAKCKLFVEYGPGVGAFTEHVLRRMAPDATLIAIDLNPDFVRYLRGKFTDSRLFPVTGSAADVSQIIADCGFDHADYVLSGLPFSTLPAGAGPKIAEQTHQVLRPGGAFLVYQVKRRARDYMAVHFKRIDKGYEWANVPPCHLFWGWKD